MNVLFRLKKDIRDFYSIKDAHDFFINILPIRDQNCFFNNNRIRELKAHDTIYFVFDGYIVSKASFTGNIIIDYERDEKYTQGHQLSNIQIIHSSKKLNYEIVSTRTKYINSQKIKNEINRVLNDKLDMYPDELDTNDNFEEGNSTKVYVNRFERDKKAREACLNHFGYNCQVCHFNFEKNYGEIGINSIHVHHIIPLSKIGQSYKVNPIEDLIPVCPNCHLILHKKNAPSIQQLKEIVGNKS